MSQDGFIVVTTTNTYRKRYAIPVSDARNHEDAIGYVTSGDAKYFALREIGEQVVDAQVTDSQTVLTMFNQDFEQAAELSDDEKLSAIQDWRVKGEGS